MTENNFRINRKKVGLTYSCPINADENPIESNEKLLEFLEDTNGHCQYIVSTELHQNGKKHYHAYVYYDEKIDTKNVKYFDFCGVHPNILRKSPGIGWIAYCKKDKEFITNMEEDPFAKALQCENVNEAMDYLWKKRPQCMALNGDRIERNMAKRMKPAVIQRTDHEKYKWFPQEDIRSTLLIGKSGIGKTQYALWSKHFEKPLLVSHMDQLLEFDNTIHDGIVFDDMDFSYLPVSTQLHLLDWDIERNVHVRYRTAHIPAQTKKIFTANVFPFWAEDEEHMKAIKRRLKVVELV